MAERLTIDEVTERLAEDLGLDVEELEREALEFDIELPWDADWEVYAIGEEKALVDIPVEDTDDEDDYGYE